MVKRGRKDRRVRIDEGGGGGIWEGKKEKTREEKKGVRRIRIGERGEKGRRARRGEEGGRDRRVRRGKRGRGGKE